MQKNIIVFLLTASLLVYFANKSNAQMADTLQKPKFERMPFLPLVLPGGTHFYQGNKTKGYTYAISELALLGTGIAMELNRPESDGFSFNTPLLLSQQMWVVDKYEYFRDMQLYLQSVSPGYKFDASPTNELLMAPFTEIFAPITLGFIGFALADGILSASAKEKRFTNIKGIDTYGMHMNRELGSLYYALSGFGLSYGAGTSEEMLFRNFLLPMYDYRYGQKIGLIATSVLFSLAHLPTYLSIDDPWYLAYSVSSVTLAGFILGRNVQVNNYSIKKVIAAHCWYNFTVMMTSWFLSPERNPLGVNIRFKF